MSHLKSLFRDMMHVRPGQSTIGWNGFSSTAGETVQASNSAIVNQVVGTAMSQQGSIGGANYYAAGVLMSQPVIDDTPYRVKAYVLSLMYCYAFVGYAPAAPTGIDTIDRCTFFPLTSRTDAGPAVAHFDEIINFPGLVKGDPYENRPLCFGLVARSFANHEAAFNICVQNLAKTAPQFAAGMS